jgi:acryloyl-coenzyme A reductase
MRVAVVNKINEDLTIEDRDEGEPKHNEVLIKQEFTGICYRDILTRDGFFPRLKTPIIPGHEVSGIIEKVGEGVQYFKKGDRVASLIYLPCGHCMNCVSGNENLCQYKMTLGENLDGAYAQYVNVNERSLVKVPSGVKNELATISACVTGMLVHGLKKVGGITEGSKTVITGAGGGVGSHAIQIAKAYGSEVVAVTSSPWKAEMLYKLGADYVISSDGEFNKKVKDIWPEGANIALENTGDATFSEAFRSLGFGGRIVVVGNLKPTSSPLPLGILILKGNTISGSISSTRADVMEALSMSAKGKIQAVISEEVTLDNVNQAFERIKLKKNMGRVFIKF